MRLRLSFVMLSGLVVLSGYHGLKTGAHRPDSGHALLPPPPPMASPQAQEDRQIYFATRQHVDSQRWRQAIHDAVLSDQQIIQEFAAAGHIRFTREEKQELTRRLENLQNAARLAMMQEKNIWQRRRPFIDYGGRSCILDHRRFITSWSYPSGHTVRGYIIALGLDSLFPGHEEELMAKAHEFAESRVICGMHWKSDIQAGELFARQFFRQWTRTPNQNTDVREKE